MPGKFYITNGCEFIGADLKAVGSLKNAKRFTYNDGQSFLQKQLQVSSNWRLQKAYQTGKKKYVITNATKFVGSCAPVVDDYTAAKSFKSAADATAYIRKSKQLNKYIQTPLIIDDSFDAVSIPTRQFTDEQLEMLGVKKQETPAPRHKISKTVLTEVYTNSAGLCALCGKPMTQWDKTVDHIIPKSKGGKDSKSNIRYAHRSCNQLKGNLLDKDMYQTVSNVGAKYVYEQPNSQESLHLVRAYLRGIINEYKQNGLITTT